MKRMNFVICMLACLFGHLWATQLTEVELLSPIANKRFTSKMVQMNAKNFREQAVAQPADMKTDIDGCRHNSGLSEYSFYVSTCPFSYFTALTTEWDERTGRFRRSLQPNFISWVKDTKGLYSEWVIDRNQVYERQKRLALAQGKTLPPLEEWVTPQDLIPVEKKYRFAIECYRRRDVPEKFLGRIALSGAWALRVHMNRPIYDTSFSSGVNEINDKIARHIGDNEEFDPIKWLKVYKEIYEGGGLSDEAVLVAGMSYLGLIVRDGDLIAAQNLLDHMMKTFKPVEGNFGIKVRGLIRERGRILRDYTTFLDMAATGLISGVRNEELSRQQLPTTILAIAESLRRSGDKANAVNWYLALARMEESEPALRVRIREQGGVPGPSSPVAMQLGKIADDMIERIKEEGLSVPPEPVGPYAPILNAIIYQGLGTAAFQNPEWRPYTGGTLADSYQMLDRLGKICIDYYTRYDRWPESLGQLWEEGVIPDWNSFNRFHCPVTGKPFQFASLGKEYAVDTVLLSTSAAISTKEGMQYIGYLADNTIITSDKKIDVGRAQ